MTAGITDPSPDKAITDAIKDLQTRMTSIERAPWQDAIGTGGVLVTGDVVGGFGPTRAGCLLMDGSTIADATWPALGAFIRANLPAAYVVDGSHVKLPDARGNVLAGANGATFVLGVATGAEAVTLTSTQSGTPAHTHPAPTITIGNESAHTHPNSVPALIAVQAGATANVNAGSLTAATGAGSSHTHTGSSSAVPASTAAPAASAHTNVQPSLPLNWFIKT